MFCDSFPFETTPDQVQAINAVLSDMCQPLAMDRLVCGDVGFGKTEVAMRAAFLAVDNHKQVAVLVPTTLLAQQHYDNFRDRFANWPVRIEMISRFRSAKEQTQILAEVAEGKIDILIGTHKLLQSDVKFKDLGLLIVDEEHRFGVRHKERIKAMRANVDILTLTATPIPRTLNMAMSGMRDLSIIATPPARRLAVKTFVREYDSLVVREAILREILRGGQVYYLYNDVENIQKAAERLAELVPEARIAIGHGQMRERELERVMNDFHHQRFNVLVCTTIIETGIDIPTANTIIIERADHFGLAQLHQLRGRVGRSHHQAYAWLLTPHPKAMTTDAQKRLEAIASLEDLGAGFALATGTYIALLDHDDILHPCALWYVAQAIAEQGADFVYTDEVTFEGDIDHLTVYHFKPDYMLDNLRSNNYICHLSVFSAKLLAAVGGDERAAFNGSQDYDLYLRLTEKAHKIVHIPHLLYYWRSSPTSVASNISAKTYCLEAAVKALYAHYERMGVPVDEVSMIPGTPGFYKTDYTITKPGRVSILIPSCDHSSDLRTCVESICRKSTYEDFEIIVIENNSREPATFRCYERLQKEHRNLRVITWQGTGFNYSALNNFGAREATGEYLLLLNNDTEVISPRWIEEMLMYAQQDRVGCVGAKLLYPDNTIQHAGIGFGFLTLAAHMHKNFPVGHPGYMGRLVYAQDVYAVTAACLMVRKSVYEQVNGLDESFAVAFNDVDFCVRVREAGYTNVFTPFAQLYHYESKSRGLDENPVKRKRFISEVERFQKRWAKQLAAGDPCMNPNFDLMKEDFSFDIKPLE
mgnify:CR=1 FL=1